MSLLLFLEKRKKALAGRRRSAMRRKRAKPNNDDVGPTRRVSPLTPSARTALYELNFPREFYEMLINKTTYEQAPRENDVRKRGIPYLYCMERFDKNRSERKRKRATTTMRIYGTHTDSLLDMAQPRIHRVSLRIAKFQPEGVRARGYLTAILVAEMTYPHIHNRVETISSEPLCGLLR